MKKWKGTHIDRLMSDTLLYQKNEHDTDEVTPAKSQAFQNYVMRDE